MCAISLAPWTRTATPTRENAPADYTSGAGPAMSARMATTATRTVSVSVPFCTGLWGSNLLHFSLVGDLRVSSSCLFVLSSMLDTLHFYPVCDLSVIIVPLCSECRGDTIHSYLVSDLRVSSLCRFVVSVEVTQYIPI